MNASLLAVLNDAERLLVAETDPAALALLDEDAVVELHTRIRRARNQYTGQYRRAASGRVSAAGGRGAARPTNRNAATKAEAFEEALARVSRRLGVLAQQSAAALKAERLAAARGEKAARPRVGSKTERSTPAAPTAPKRAPARGDQALRSPASAKKRASTQASGARRQAKRDSR